MRRSVRELMFAAAMAALLSACGNGGGGSDGGTGGGAGGGFAAGGGAGGGGGATNEDAGLSASNYCARYANAYCSRQAQCGPLRLVNLNDCFNDAVRTCELSIGSGARGAGLELDVAAADRCLSELPSAQCDLLSLTHDAFCLPSTVTRPGSQVGEVCSSSTCVGSWCRLDGGGVGCGTCESYLPLGASCTPGLPQCDPDAGTCLLNALGSAYNCRAWLEDGQGCTSAGSCRSRLCPNRTDGGRWCGALDIGESCTNTTNCGPDAFCRGLGTGQQASCRPRISVGAPCTDQPNDDGCRGIDATCLDGVCKIVPFGTRTEGQSCDEADQCAANQYCSGLQTSNNRNGACSPQLGADAGCTGVDPRQCAEGLLCVQQVCQPYRMPGQPCVTAAQCIPYSRCAGVGDGGFECFEYVSPGQICPTAAACLGGYCERNANGTLGACTQYKPNGAACTSVSECLSSRCVLTNSTAGTRECSPGCF